MNGAMSDTTTAGGAQWFGHPRGLSTLFFTEMWERFSYYGMRALLGALHDRAGGGGQRRPRHDGSSRRLRSTRLYTFSVYVLALPGGWIADRLIGQRRAVFVGGVIIAAGHLHVGGACALNVLPGLGSWSFSAPVSLSRMSAPLSPISIQRGAPDATPVSRSSTWGSTSAPCSARRSVRSWEKRSAGTWGSARPASG